MYARLTTYVGEVQDYESTMASTRKRVLERLPQVEGYRGVLGFTDREVGKAFSISLWDSEEAMRAAENIGNEIRQDIADTGGTKVDSVERGEVSVLEVRPV